MNFRQKQVRFYFKMAFKVLLILAICVHAFVHAKQSQDELTDAQIKRIFHRNRDELPNYKTAVFKTSRSHRSKRELRPVEFEVDGKKTRLNLTPSKHNTMADDIPVWTVETDHQKTSGHVYNKLDREKVKYDGVFYEDKRNMATLLAYYKDRNIFYDGVFGESYLTKVVRSVPESWWKPSGNESYDDHVVFDVNKDNSETETIGETQSTSDADKLDKPLNVLYPKLLLIIEYNYFKALAEDVSETIKYVATFWNAVNLKYSKLTSPRVNVVITGVIIAKDDTALKYIYEARNQSDMDSMNHIKLLNSGSDYFRDEFKNEVNFENYDSTMTMTNLNAGAVAGSAYPGKICSSNLNVGFVKDDASFSGVLSGTHELGHLLNLPHDGAGAAKDCQAYPDHDISTVMAAFMIDVKGFIWSKCSETILREFATTKASECMRYPYRI